MPEPQPARGDVLDRFAATPKLHYIDPRELVEDAPAHAAASDGAAFRFGQVGGSLIGSLLVFLLAREWIGRTVRRTIGTGAGLLVLTAPATLLGIYISHAGSDGLLYGFLWSAGFLVWTIVFVGKAVRDATGPR